MNNEIKSLFNLTKFNYVQTDTIISSVFMRPCPLTRYTVKNVISNLYILHKSALQMQEMPFQRPKFQILSGGHALDSPTIVSSLWPPPH